MYGDLQTGDPVEMGQRIYDHLSNMDESNWQDLFDQTLKITKETGRTHDGLWEDVLIRTGQVAGEAVMDHWSEMGLEDHSGASRLAYYGWAMSDPDAAQQWLERNLETDSAAYRRLLPVLGGGMALNYPHKLPVFMAGLGPQEQLHCGKDLVRNLIQGGGIAEADRWLDEVMTDSWSPELAALTFNELARSVGRTVIDGDHQLASNWLDRYRDSENLTASHIDRIARSFWGATSIQGLDFLLGASNIPVMLDQQAEPPRLNDLVGKAYRSAPDDLEAWLNANRDAPFRESAIASMVNLMEANGESDRAAQWREGEAPQ